MSAQTASPALHPVPPAKAAVPLYKSLFFQVVVALVLGVVIGMTLPDFAIGLKVLSDAFLKLISMIVAPIVFCVVVHGIAGAGDLKKVGRVGVKALIYFEAMTTVALALGLVIAYLVGPGHGMNIDTATLDGKAMGNFADNAHKLQGGGLSAFLLNIIPTTSFDALARNDVLQVLFFAVLFGVSLSLYGGEKGRQVSSLIDAIAGVLFKAMGLIVRVAPLGVLGAVAYTVGKYGVGSLKQLLSLVVLYYVTVAIFVLVILGAVMRLAGINLLKFLAYFREELTIVLGTASSDAVLPQIMAKLRYLGIKPSTVGLVVPTGYSFNLDAFSIYLTLAVVFIAQATGTPLSFGDLLIVLGVSLVTSKGAHGVPGSAIVILAATLNAVPTIPAIGLVLVLSVDWFIGMARAVGNLIGNCVATVVVAAWEGDLDKARAKTVLDSPPPDMATIVAAEPQA
ncbi:dicarboxylate/amino acid:cation symporter [Methylobacterium brachythecii]|uniref:Aerobic C4-dicarboxylate transport protein n=1 Tax=Methylobacterium brachythecii TaxID=1176177 RepID=A0A7W6F891_9HYPH|nr:dicarboxylate/amino acid:cation symporter [Methylobacterium brachythecii]MBB3904252.1 aerobic C4-dicarboxylate transport protein [Methylobacterium brachythecii]GLS45086.1 C4-dicarboxylate transporter DctA [Methylobacterium brachythecii]